MDSGVFSTALEEFYQLEVEQVRRNRRRLKWKFDRSGGSRLAFRVLIARGSRRSILIGLSHVFERVPLSFGFLVNVTVVESTSRVRTLWRADHTREKTNKYQGNSQSQSRLQYEEAEFLKFNQSFDNWLINSIKFAFIYNLIQLVKTPKKIHEIEE